MPSINALSSPSGSLLLAIEASQRQASVALRDAHGVIHHVELSPKKRHDDDLLPAIDRMFARAGLRSDDLRGGAVAVSTGPGGFTGLRIAVATAKMLAETLNVTLVAVPSALVAAEGTLSGQSSAISDQSGSSGIVLVALACKGETFWLTRIEREAASGGWMIRGQPGIARAEAFELAGVSAALADEHFPDAARARVMSANIPVIEPRFDARASLAVGERMLERGEMIDPLRLAPLYPREPEAVTLWQVRAHATNTKPA